MSEVFASGVESSVYRAVKKVFLAATNKLEWLSEGDLVLLKPALNSSNKYPATTHPGTVQIVAKILKDAGAEVVIGDQSGVGYVRHSPQKIKGSTRDNYIKSGMAHNGQARFIGFETQGWDEGFYNFKTPSWKKGFFITNWVKKANHIINLPRLSAHAQAGVTLGFKNFVGLLREDSRLEFHSNGPFNLPFNLMTRSKHQKTSGDFFKMITEISLATKNKLRLTFFTGAKAQLTFGPDKGYVLAPKEPIVFASDDQVSAELFAISYLSYLYNSLPFYHKLFQKMLVRLNGRISLLTEQKPRENPFVKHALHLGLGDRRVQCVYTGVSQGLIEEMEKLMLE